MLAYYSKENEDPDVLGKQYMEHRELFHHHDLRIMYTDLTPVPVVVTRRVTEYEIAGGLEPTPVNINNVTY